MMKKFMIDSRVTLIVMIGLATFLAFDAALADPIDEFLPPVPLDDEVGAVLETGNAETMGGGDNPFEEELGPVPLVRKVIETLQQFFPIVSLVTK